MEHRIEALLEKYWNGETSLEEEKELKLLIAEASGYAEEKAFFSGTTELALLSSDLPLIVSRSSWTSHWAKIAAVFCLFIISGSLWYSHWQRLEQQRAYEQVLEAFVLINNNLQLGTRSLEALEDFRYLNTAQEIFHQDKATYEKVD
jgi:hypothetical protein